MEWTSRGRLRRRAADRGRAGEAARRAPLAPLSLLLLAACGGGGSGGGGGGATGPGGSTYDPSWARATPARVLTLDFDGGMTAAQNGAALKAAVQALQPGDRLEIGAGTYSVDSYFSIDLVGTPTQPIVVAAQAGATPVITRVNASQNTVNVGQNGGARYLRIEGLEIIGGSIALRMHDVQNVQVDSCHIHHCQDNAVAVNSHDTAWIWLTRNEIHDTGGTGEGMYLGANNGVHVMRHSVIAQNLVYNCGGTQGDGIELKQGSYDNLIAENVVHDTNYPCILVYGTDGNAPNVVERNTCWGSNDNVMQVQGEAIVRNNLILDGAVGFSSHDHQGQSRDLVFVHNTVVNTGRAVNLSSWGGRPGMVFANNVCYSQNGDSVRFAGGSAGVQLAGNLVVGPVMGAGGGWATGNGLADFAGVTWTGSSRDARPAPGGAIPASGDVLHEEPVDLTGAARVGTVEAGAYDAP